MMVLNHYPFQGRLTLLKMLHFALLYRGAGKSCGGGQNRGAARSRGAYRLLADKPLMHKTEQKMQDCSKINAKKRKYKAKS